MARIFAVLAMLAVAAAATSLPAQAPIADQAPAAPSANALPPAEQALPNLPPLDGRIDLRIALVGNQPILLSDVLPTVNDTIRSNELEKRLPPEDMAKVRVILAKRALQPIITRKVVWNAIQTRMPEQAISFVRGKIEQHFEENEIPRLMKDLEVQSRADLVRKMEQRGVPLAKYKQDFVESMFTVEWVKQTVKAEKEITHDEALRYYQEHLGEFEFPAKARWEQLTVNITPSMSREQARAKLAFMGNAVLAGAPFAEIARKYSDDPNAPEGGYHDWTSQGSLASEVLDKRIFELDAGKMSEIIEDLDAVHIVRVIERRAAGRIPFAEAQSQIKKTLQQQFKTQKQQEFMEKLRAETFVWTIFDGTDASATASRPAPASR